MKYGSTAELMWSPLQFQLCCPFSIFNLCREEQRLALSSSSSTYPCLDPLVYQLHITRLYCPDCRSSGQGQRRDSSSLYTRSATKTANVLAFMLSVALEFLQNNNVVGIGYIGWRMLGTRPRVSGSAMCILNWDCGGKEQACNQINEPCIDLFTRLAVIRHKTYEFITQIWVGI